MRRCAQWAIAFVAGLLLLGSMPISASASPARTPRGAEIEISAKDEEFPLLVERIARATGEIFLFDETLRGRVTITVGHPVRPREALAILDAALLMKGFAVLESGNGVHKILPIGEAGAAAPVSGERETGSSFLTTLVRLRVAAAETIAAKLKHLVGQNRSALAYPPTNSLILVGTEVEIRRLIELAGALDTGVPDDLLVRTLQHRAADVIRELALEVLQPGIGKEPIKLWSDARTNTILAVGTPQQLAEARVLLASLDVPSGSVEPVRVFRLRHRDAEELAAILRAMGAGRGRAGARPASGAQPSAGDVLSGRAFNIVAEPGTNALLMDADPDTLALLREVIRELDRDTPQVLVEVTAFEISNPTTLALGVDWFLPVELGGSNKVMSLTSNPSGGGLRAEAGPDNSFFGRVSRDPLLVPILGPSGIPAEVVVPRETAVVTADSREIKTRVLMQPRLVMTAGEEHEMFSGTNIPIPIAAQPAQAGTGTALLAGIQTRSEIQRQDIGIVLRVEPKLGQAGKVVLSLGIEISRIGESIAGAVERVGPTIEKREVTTKIALADGEVAVIGTSQQRVLASEESAIPFLRDIPLLGHLTRASRTATEDVHVVFSVQARILKTPVEVLADSIRERLAFQRSLSRVRDLEPETNAPYALLLDTFEAEADAEELAERMEARGGTAQVGRFEDHIGELYDVYLTGYSNLVLAGEAARALYDRGYRPRVVVLPSAPALAHTPQFSAISSGYPLLP